MTVSAAQEFADVPGDSHKHCGVLASRGLGKLLRPSRSKYPQLAASGLGIMVRISHDGRSSCIVSSNVQFKGLD